MALPLVLFSLTKSWVFLAPSGFLDPYIYTGFFLDLPTDLQRHPDTYYGSRLPWILFGHLFYSFFSAEAANLLLRFALFYSAALGTFTCVYTITRSRPAAFLTAFLLTLNIYFLSAIAWDYVNGVGIVCLLLTLATLSIGATTDRYLPVYLSVAGFLITTTFSVQLFLIALTPALIYWFLALRLKQPSWRLADCALSLICGAAVAMLFYSIVNKHFTGNLYYLKPQWDQAGEGGEQYSVPLSQWIESSGWLVLPAVGAVAALGLLARSIFLWQRRRALNPIPLLTDTAASVPPLLVGLTFCAVQFGPKGSPVLQLWTYAGYLLPFACISIGSVFALGLKDWRPARGTLLSIAVAVVLLAPFYLGSDIAAKASCDECSLYGRGGTFAVAIGLVLLGNIFLRNWGLAIVALVGLSLINPGSGQFSYAFYGDEDTQYSRFLMVYSGEEAVRPFDNDGKLKFWYDYKEPLGGVFTGITSLHLWTFKIISYEFPSLTVGNYTAVAPGDTLAVLSNQPSVLEAANDALKHNGLQVSVREKRSVRRGKDEFTVTLLAVAPAGVTNERKLPAASLKSYAGATVLGRQDGVLVTTQEIPFAYAAAFPIPAIADPQPAGRAFVRVQGKLDSGPVGFGVLKKDRSNWVSTVKVDITGAFDAYVVIPNLADTSDFVVMNWDQKGRGRVEVKEVTLYIVGDGVGR